MILRGLMDQSLGGFVCIRGYAPLGELARVSYADTKYQRDLIKTQRERIITFLSNKKSLFFPEVILSCLLEYDFSKPGAVSGLQPLANVLEGKRFKSNVNGITVSSKTLSFAGKADARQRSKLPIATLEIPDDLIDDGAAALFRIDGNHRLSAVDEKPDFKSIVAPFCVILFGSSEDDTRNSKIIFHNINAKSIPLTSEENLKIILDDEVLFPDQMLKEDPSFGWQFLLARKALPAIDEKAVPALKEVLAHRRAALVHLFKLLLDGKVIKKSTAKLPDVQKSLATVHRLYEQDDDLQRNECVGLFHAFVYFCLTDKEDAQFGPFQAWVKGNHLAAMKSTDAEALIDIFERVHTAKSRTVFISMPFGDVTEATYKTIKKTIDQINESAKPKIKIQPLRIDELIKGHSYVITDEILDAIENSGLLIADLTQGNKNVYHEVGFLMGLNRARTGNQDNFILLVRTQDAAQVENDVGFNLKGVSQIRFEEMNELEERLTVEVRKYYELS